MTLIGLRPIHVIGMVLALTMFYQSFRLVRSGKGSVFEFLLWSCFGTMLFALSLGDVVTLLRVYEAMEVILAVLGFGSGLTGLLVLSNLALLMMLFYTFVKVKTNRKELYDLNQEIALSQFENNRD
ncbi:DUF2304 domain-containing protein [Halorubrum kocurii]|uniref:Uncharacterized protein n=1 Tax=Halorubrum kocurii JCM 14978 TaxID=1230456 RepID=M0PL83_9EURY|nr:DUF2304 domain-containing protein [Halorubrum kocurii]EMA70389.1 hypothetical protein C468_00105 [Halorubrum kocurii JCM 14978]